MAEEVWATVIVALVSIIGIVLTQYLSYRGSRETFVFQTRAGFFQEAYRDHLWILHCTSKIEMGMDTENNIQEIENTINKHPYNFPFGFLIKWLQVKDILRNRDPNKPIPEMKELLDNLQPSLRFYSLKYFGEVLGIKRGKEGTQLIEALRGTLRKPS